MQIMMSGDVMLAVQVTAAGTGSVTAGRWSLVLSGWPNCCRSSRGELRVWASLDRFLKRLKILQPKKSRVNLTEEFLL